MLQLLHHQVHPMHDFQQWLCLAGERGLASLDKLGISVGAGVGRPM
jgi:hypothetical protein